MGTRAESKIDRIMSDAYREAFKVLEAEVKAFMHADPRFIKYSHMIGWGPRFHLSDGKVIIFTDDMPTKRGRELLEFCNNFYDAHGARNEIVQP